MNWAEEVAVKFLGDYFWTGESAKMAKADIIKALRKAKADGMRQAISIIRMQDGFKVSLIEAFEKAEAVAAEIEKGNPG